MKTTVWLASVAIGSLMVPVTGALAAADTALAHSEASEAAEPQDAKNAPPAEIFSTGVAKGRDRLDSATSTSSLRATEIEKFGARSLAEVFRNIPGIRAEAIGEGLGNYTIRGLPLASSGSKWLNFQEDGLPVVEFGDLNLLTPDSLMRFDLNVGQIETIRGGSASTFASNSPGGVINLISKTGDVEGGALQASTGIDYQDYRVDFSYGARLSETVRFHVGGYYREGEGPRDNGFTAYRGGQIKFNITKDLPTGYIRLYGKYLSDRTPLYQGVPIAVTGTNEDPRYSNVAGFDASRDVLQGRNISNYVIPNGQNNLTRFDARQGINPTVKSIGLEAQFDVGDWTITERFRYSDIGGSVQIALPLATAPAPLLMGALGAPGGRLRYANGDRAGQLVANPATINGNGLLVNNMLFNTQMKNMDNITNDLRASRVWKAGAGELTTTVGLYTSRQSVFNDFLGSSIINDVRGGGNTALVDLITAGGTQLTQGGFFNFNGTVAASFDADYQVLAPYASVNYKVGKFSFGGSVRFDRGNVEGQAFGYTIGATNLPTRPVDINRDGTISPAETRTTRFDFNAPSLVDYNYNYVSYSASVNYRASDSLAAFARYSRGGRAAADRILLTPAINPVTGRLAAGEDGYDAVTQTELGLKFRKSNVTLNVTGFLADTSESNLQVTSNAAGDTIAVLLARDYRAYGLEFEGAVTFGGFSLTAGATYTKAEIRADRTQPQFVGNTPRRQPHLIFQATPQYSTDLFTVGVNVVGHTDSYTQDQNQLRLPGFTIVSPFLQVRPADRVTVMLNVNNVFDTMGIVEISQGALPATGVVTGRTINPRTVSAAVRFNF
ncbi:TonB-dependent receptor [Sphingomonas changnyeongensis]|uniref:TonB-dependent receptor n=1 Tax=Sphingomonas changnyeongensis TaxID=2698679 RepID=A0A7Z2NWY2_9SPHN|nr:TonB-dependent receptor [Sphingomonas changnyeongensis]QHL91267.1 TonB-dependent receptor [Sphingomonas changnyeongensis]